MCFHVNIATFSRTPILKNICQRLLLSNWEYNKPWNQIYRTPKYLMQFEINLYSLLKYIFALAFTLRNVHFVMVWNNLTFSIAWNMPVAVQFKYSFLLSSSKRSINWIKSVDWFSLVAGGETVRTTHVIDLEIQDHYFKIAYLVFIVLTKFSFFFHNPFLEVRI